jgi:hypothetical protein
MGKRTIEDVLGAIKVPVRSVRICLDADLYAEHDELVVLQEELRREGGVAKMGQTSEAKAVAEQIRALEKRMHESEVTFKFRGLTKAGLKRLQGRFPPPEPNPKNWVWDVDEGAPALLALSAIEPTMTEADAKALLEVIDEGRAGLLVGAAWLASTGSTDVPFSARASELTSGTGSN